MSERVPGQREPQASDAEPVELALGAGMAFEGLLVLPRRARIDGRLGGEVLAGGPVWVGPTGEVEADLEADSVVVEGRVHGNLRAPSRWGRRPSCAETSWRRGSASPRAPGSTGAVRAETPGRAPPKPAPKAFRRRIAASRRLEVRDSYVRIAAPVEPVDSPIP